MNNSCLLVVDVQNDFCPGGALGVKDGDVIIPVINRIMHKFDLVIATRDMHPADTVHFNKWPPHCVAGTPGAAFHPDLDTDAIHMELHKGTRNSDDGYSAFEATTDDLKDILAERFIDTVYICGLATDYCVLNTVLDARAAGLNTRVIADAVRAVNVSPEDGEQAIRKMQAAGAVFLDSEKL